MSVVSWPSTGDCLQLVQAACSSFPHGVPQGGCLPPQDQQRRGRRIGRLQKTDTEILGNIITWLCACNHVYPTTVALFYWLEVSHRFRLHSKDGNLTRARMPIGKGPRGHLKSVCYTHVFKFLFIDSSSVEEWQHWFSKPEKGSILHFLFCLPSIIENWLFWDLILKWLWKLAKSLPIYQTSK